MNKKLKKLILLILILIDFYFVYSTIGYTYLGFTSPKIEGLNNAYFMGNYMLALVFFSLTIINTLFIYIINKRIVKSRDL